MKLNQVMTVAWFTFRDAVRKKSFVVTCFIYAAVVIAGCFFLSRGDMFGGGMDMDVGMHLPGGGAGYGATCYFLDESGSPLLAGAREALEQSGMDVIPIAPGDMDATLALVKEDKSAGLVHLRPADVPQAEVCKKNAMSAFPAGAVSEILDNVYRTNQFAAAGYDAELSGHILQSGLLVTATDLQNFSNYIAGMVLMFVMFMTIYVYGYGVAMSVATEKSTRVMETLIVSAKPSRVLVGKCLGMGSVGLIQLLGVLCLSGACSKLFAPEGSGGALSLPDLTFERAALLVLYFLLGYALFSMINSMCGAMVSKMEDLQSAMMPAALVSVLSFYGGYAPTLGGGAASKLTLLIPFTAPYAAPSVLLSGEYDMTTIALSIGILLVTIAAVSYISGKVYAASVLHYGSRLRFGDVKRMIKGK